MSAIYLDYNATTPVDPDVLSSMLGYLETQFGNPSSIHSLGTSARQGIERAREQLGHLLGCNTDEIIFTSGGTESNNSAIIGAALAHKDKGKHLITAAIEHPAVLEPMRFLESLGWQVTVLPVDKCGQVDPSSVEQALRDETVLVSVMHANNEVGTIQPIKDIARLTHKAGALLHCDAAQSVGKVPVKVDQLEVDLLSVAGHKVYAPKGVGALYVRQSTQMQKFMHGASHESNRRAGTENVASIVGLGQAAELADKSVGDYSEHTKHLTDTLWMLLEQSGHDVRRNGHPVHCLPNTLSVGFRNIKADELVASLSDKVAISAGAACHASGVTISSVLQAMNVPHEYAMGTIRISLGRYTTLDQVHTAAQHILSAVSKFQT